MDRSREIKEQLIRSIDSLRESFEYAIKNKESSDFKIFRDSTILRFELTYELLWKYAQKYLYEHEGLEVRSPKGVFRELFIQKKIDEEQFDLFMQMVSDRNQIVHIYNEKLADKIFCNIDKYIKLSQTLTETLRW